MENVYAAPRTLTVAELETDRRAAFILKTYGHLIGSILAFTALEVLLFSSGLAQQITAAMLQVNWLFILGAFLVVSWIASRVAHRTASLPLQYLALGAFIVAEALIFVPLLFIVNLQVEGGIASAALVTIIAFLGLTWVAFATRKDFSFLGGLVRWGMICALALIVAGGVFGFELGTFFSVAMVALAGAAILWDTSNILHHYPEDRYVGAALQLFASVALMFWYVLRLVLSRD
ncbi:MAG: Bax inhibitor-1 family protein [Acidobacteriota bacterium]